MVFQVIFSSKNQIAQGIKKCWEVYGEIFDTRIIKLIFSSLLIKNYIIYFIIIQNMRKIQVDAGIDKSCPTSTFVLLIYNQYQLPTVCEIVSSPVDIQDNYLLLKNANKKSQCQILIKVGEKVSKQEQISIQKLIAICDRIVCIELNQQLQSKIQKMYLSFVPQLYARYGQIKTWIQHPSLFFINESYKKSYSRQIQGIHYFRTVSQLLASKLVLQTLKMSSVYSIFEKDLQKRIESDQVPSLTVKQFLSVYHNEALSQKQACQIKYSILAYKESVWNSNKRDRAQQLIFQQGQCDGSKQILRQIDRLGLEKKEKNKLSWKHARLDRFKVLIEEQKRNKQLVREYKNMAIYDLTPETIVLELKQFYRIWITNTLKQLKISFKAIANRRDTKALSQFRNKCIKTMQIINNCELECQQNTLSLQMVWKMREQFKQFIAIHQKVIQDEYLSIFKYVPYQIKFIWRNQSKIYHKIGVFGLILLLAWIQKNVIIGITLISLGIIFSAINI